MVHAGDHGHHMMPATSPDCRAGDTAYLTSLAYCLDTKCPPEVLLWEKEQFWVAPETTGDAAIPAKWSYQVALEQLLEGIPNVTWAMGNTLNVTMVVNDTFWCIQYRFWPVMDHNSILMYRYS